MNIPNGKSSHDETIEFFAKRKWGSVVDDDKYWSDIDITDNFILFYCYAFSYLDLPSPTRPQLEMAKFIAERKNPRRLVWAMRGLSKSLTSQIYVVWRLLLNPNEHILVLSKSSSRAGSYTQFVKKLIGLLPITKPMSPRNNIDRTASQMFDVVGAMASDSASVYAAGVGNELTGFRGSLLIIDDVETSLTVHSQALTEKVKNGVEEAYKLLMSGSLESITLATPHSVNSMYLEWMENGTEALIIPAEYPEDKSVYMGKLAPFISKQLEADESLIGQAVDERINKEFLIEQRNISKRTYRLQYLLDISDSEENRFPLRLSDFIVMDVDEDEAPLKIGYSSMPDNMLYMKHNGFKKDRLYMPNYVSDERMKYDMRIMSIDPSGRGKDETGISIIYSLNTRLFIKKITGIEGGYSPEALTNIATLCNQHRIDSIVIEDNFGDGLWTQQLEPYIRKYSPMTGVDEVKSKGQKEMRIIDSIEPILSQHKLIIDKEIFDKEQNSKTKNSFSYQLSHITEERDCLLADDRIDSLSMGIQYMSDKMSLNEDFGFELLQQQEQEELDKLNDVIIGLNSSSSSMNFSSGW